MTTANASFSLVFPPWFDEQAQFEAASKGCLSDVEVHLQDGRRYRLYFIDPVRLGQDLEEQTREGRPFLAEPNLVVVPEVTLSAMQLAVAGMLTEGFFGNVQPLACR